MDFVPVVTGQNHWSAGLLIKMAGKRKKTSVVKPLQIPMFPEKKAA